MKTIKNIDELDQVYEAIYETEDFDVGSVNLWFRDNEPSLEFLDPDTTDSAKDATYQRIRSNFEFEFEDDF